MTDQLWNEHKGTSGPGAGKHIVLVSGDEEYRSEEALPMMAKILSAHHGFDCTVLFAIDPETGEIDPEHQTNIPGLDALDSADLMLIFTRFRELPDAQMKHIVDYVNSGRPIMGLRTATHAFQYSRDKTGPYAKYDCTNEEFEGGFGRQVLGDTWVAHHGHHGYESTRALINPGSKDHPILQGVEDVWGTTDVYAVGELTGNPQVLLDGQVLVGMDHDDEPKPDTITMPIAWIKEYTGDEGKASRVFCTTMGAATDLRSDDLRRLLVNAAYWGMGMEDSIDPSRSVDTVGEYNPTPFGFGTHQKGRRPSDYA
ncbi:MAG: ThuA domain-containing protein [bacterium]|nr:ThuA domain-containing protein [bacterium]